MGGLGKFRINGSGRVWRLVRLGDISNDVKLQDITVSRKDISLLSKNKTCGWVKKIIKRMIEIVQPDQKPILGVLYFISCG